MATKGSNAPARAGGKRDNSNLVAPPKTRKDEDKLATALQRHPGLTAMVYAEKYKIPLATVLSMRHFVAEYIKDFCEESACLRMGYPETAAASNGLIFLRNAFVQLRLFEVINEIDADNIVSGNAVIAKLWQEANRPDTVSIAGAVTSNSRTRISALKELAKIKGLSTPKGQTKTENPSGGVMLVPFYVAPDQWEAHALESQRNLKESVIETSVEVVV